MTTYNYKSHSLMATVVTGLLLTSSLPVVFAEQRLSSVTRALQQNPQGPGFTQTVEPTSNSTATNEPTFSVTDAPTVDAKPPTESPTIAPTGAPTAKPTRPPTRAPTRAPVTPDPTPSGTLEPTLSPTPSPTVTPTATPTAAPTREGTSRPSFSPLDDDQPANADPIEGRTISETVIIAVAAAGGGVVLLLAWAMFLKFRYRNKRKGGSSANTKKTSTINNNNFQSNMTHQETAAEIIVPHGHDDVSTIGDPAGVYSGESTAYERQKRMFDDDYSLNTASLERMIDVQSSRDELPPYTDETPSFKQLPVLRETPTLHDPGECFDIAAPPGKLGVILEEDSDDGVPVVHSIKEESPLVGRVLRGDRLCSIDGVDCTGKTPHEVAKLLKYKETEPTRILTFSRPTSTTATTLEE